MVCSAVLPVRGDEGYAGRRAVPRKAAEALNVDGLPKLHAFCQQCASHLQMPQLKQPLGAQIMSRLQTWVTRLCGTTARVGGTAGVLNNTLAGYNASSKDFPEGGVIHKMTFSGLAPSPQCQLAVKPQNGGVGVRALASGIVVRQAASEMEDASAPPSHAEAAASSVTEAEQLRMERGIMAQRLAASTARS